MGSTAFDRMVMAAYDQFAGRWPAFDHLLIVVANNNLLKGGVLMAVFWGLWFTTSCASKLDTTRQRLLVALLATCTAEVFTVALLHLFPFRQRPLVVGPPLFRLPDGVAATVAGWEMDQAFPSDHATLFGGLAIAVCFLTWRVGLPLLLYTLAVILVFVN